MKKTLLFSNLIGDISSSNSIDQCSFNEYTAEYLKNNVKKNSKLVFIDAPGFGNEENYLNTIINCFKKIGVFFDKVIDINKQMDDMKGENVVYFLMGGNPITQFEIIKKNNLELKIKNHQGLVIGFCAGAINLSKYAIITSDQDFNQPDSYLGLNRIDLTLEPHYESELKRDLELKGFAKKYNIEILAIPDQSIIIVEDDQKIEKGKIYRIS